MKKTLYEIVDDILNDMDADKVNSIVDTVESEQVAQIVKTCYYEMLSNRNWAFMRKLIQLDALADLDKPNYLRVPDNVKEMDTLRYQVQKITDPIPILDDIKYKYPDEFLRYIARRNGDNVKQVTDFSGSLLLIYDNQAPQYWTSFDDQHIVTDSYDKELDDTLKKSKSQAMAYVFPSWTHEDDFVPELPAEAFSALIEESKSTAFLALKQMANQKAEQKASRQQRWLARKNQVLNNKIRYQDFGRKSRK